MIFTKLEIKSETTNLLPKKLIQKVYGNIQSKFVLTPDYGGVRV